MITIILRACFYGFFTFMGIALFLIGEKNTTYSNIICGIGSSMFTVGLLSILTSVLIYKTESKETGDIIADKIFKRMQTSTEVKKSSDILVDKIYKRLRQSPPCNNGIFMVEKQRRGYKGYYNWVNEKNVKDMFIAGRSCLHRMSYDIITNYRQQFDQLVYDKLQNGTKIRILFLDPRSTLIERLAKEEGQSPLQMYQHISKSIGITKQIYENLKNQNFKSNGSRGELYIRIYDEIPSYAYHKIDDNVILGFYFADALRVNSPAFVITGQAGECFNKHFEYIFDRSCRTSLLEVSPHSIDPIFNDNLYSELYQDLTNKLGTNQTDDFINIDV